MVIAELQHGHVPTDVVRDIVRRLEKGEVLVLPTDTVYGLHVHAKSEKAVKRLREIKGIKEINRPFTVLFSTVVDIGRWVVLPEGNDRRKIVEAWPGPVTWVLQASEKVPSYLLGADKTLGIRIPKHPLLRALCTAMDDLIVSTSANFHGEPPATSRQNFPADLMEKVDGAVFELEPLSGKPSEVKRWTAAGPEVIRTRTNDQSLKREKINILVVCSGNICRSPMAEVMIAAKLNEKAPKKFVVRSAGTLANFGNRASLQAIEVTREMGLNLSGHLSRPVSLNLVEWADVILAMTPDHLGDLHAVFPQHSDKMHLITTFPSTNLEGEPGIEDPYGMDIETYRKVANEIVTNVDRIVDRLLEYTVQK